MRVAETQVVRVLGELSAGRRKHGTLLVLRRKHAEVALDEFRGPKRLKAGIVDRQGLLR